MHYSEANGLVPSQLLLKNNFITNEYSLPLLPASAFEVPLTSTHQLYSVDVSGRLGGGEITLSAFSWAETEAPQKACALPKAAWLMGEADHWIPRCQLPVCLPGTPGTRRTPHATVCTELWLQGQRAGWARQPAPPRSHCSLGALPGLWLSSWVTRRTGRPLFWEACLCSYLLPCPLIRVWQPLSPRSRGHSVT